MANYDLPTVYASVPFPNKAFEQNPMFDNLRTGQHLNAKADFDRLNALPPHAAVVLAAEYDQDAAFGIYEPDGLLRPDLDVRFARLKAGQERIEPGTHIWFVSEGAIRRDALVRAFCDRRGVQLDRVAGQVYLVR